MEMRNIKNVTKFEFLEAYDRNKPGKFISWIYKYYTTNLKQKPTPIGSWSSLSSFGIATVGMILFDQLGYKTISKNFAFFYLPFLLWGILALSAYLINNARTSKIADELNITIEDYNILAEEYLQ